MITDSETYHFKTASTTSNRIIVNGTGITPTIYLHDVAISTSSGNAIDIKSGSPTIMVDGTSNSVISSSDTFRAGIYVAKGSSVTIQGSSTSDVLQVAGGRDGAGIGGYYEMGCGDIIISKVTVHAYACEIVDVYFAPGIGSTNSTCGKITITNAIVHARGFSDDNSSSPAIGAFSSVPNIIISGSVIHAYRGSHSGNTYADYIGRGGDRNSYSGGAIQYGGGSITSSTINKYTYDWSTNRSSSNGSATYDENGNATTN